MIKKKVLIIDNEQDLLDVLELYLTEEGYAVTTATSTDDIQALVKKHKPDLIVLDYIHHREWGIGGNSLGNQLKSNARTKHLPVILLSASTEAKYGYANCSYDKLISKPFDLSELIHQLKDTFIHYRQNNHLFNRWFNRLKFA
jgi:DNA-binding response OmpR family regulator